MSKYLRLALLPFLLTLVACAAAGQPAPTPQPSPSPEALAPPLPAPLVLTFWHSWSGKAAQALDLLARRYEQEHPMVRISLQSRPAASLVRDYGAGVADGSAPQLLLVRSRYLGELAARQYVLPLEDQALATGLPDMLPAAVESARVAGVLHGVPLTFESLMLFFDRRNLAEAPQSFEQLLAYTPPQATTTPEPGWGLAYYLSAASTLPYLYAFDGEVFAPDGTVALDTDRRDAALRWLEWLQALRGDQRTMVSDDYGMVDAMIQSNRAAASIDWSHRLADYQRIWGAEMVGLAALPGVDGQGRQAPGFVLAEVICINTVTSAQQRAPALDFVRYLIGGEAQELFWTRASLLPASRRVDLDGLPTAAQEIAATGRAFPNGVADARAWPLIDEMVRSVVAGSATPVEALEKAAGDLRAIQSPP